MKKILLMGNPNVGKSVIFSRLTGVRVIASNYPGTTVGYTRGTMKLSGEKAEVVDVPGTYSLNPTCKAEEVAVEMCGDGDLVINVVDATNLERNLNLTLQLLKKDVPMVVALNMWDEAKHIGVTIDENKLEHLLGVPVVPTVAVTGEGIKDLVQQLPQARPGRLTYDDEERWHEIGRIVEQVQQVTHRHHTFLERLGDASINPISGIPIALVALGVTFSIIRFLGEGLIGYIFEPIFENMWAPLMMKLSAILGSGGFLHDILIGKLVAGEIDFVESMGLLTTGLFVPLAMVLPYVFAFYLILSFLEDSGYLPRLAILVDNIMHRIGLHGLAIIPMLLGLGCNVPGAMSTRILETRKERFISTTLMAICVPCAAQLAMIVGLVGRAGVRGLIQVFGTLALVWITLGYLLNRLIRGESPEIFVEIPPYRLPYLAGLSKKMWMRVSRFLREAIPFVILGVLIVNVLYTLKVIDFVGKITAPVITGILGLPREAVAALMVGFLRKDVAVGMLSPLGLDFNQLVVASVVLAMYFPCVATFVVMAKELGLRDMVLSMMIMIAATLVVGGVLNWLL
ncbi:MAG: iron transporter FeoB [candidate division Zixibacteria bacterium SM23_81]|nr:MAG: iron transporter FeoB [candidate division Zixibacteria bacterium SM23_81]